MRLNADGPGLREQVAAVRSGQASPSEVVDEALRRMAQVEPALGAIVASSPGRARQEAALRGLDPRSGNRRGRLHGASLGVKDLFDVAGEVTTAGSELPPTGRPALRDAAAVARLRAEGAIVVGRTRTHEYAWGLTTQHPTLGGTRNPHDLDRVPGGSSGGSAAAVAAGIVALALASDTAGSIRVPAAWCGLVGHKPTRGLVDLRGTVPLAPSFDHAGALVRTVADARLALAVLTGRAEPPPVRTGLRGLRIGVPEQPGRPAADVQQIARRDALLALAEAAGAELVAVRLPPCADVQEAFVAVQAAEALAYHRSLGHWPDHAEAYSPALKERLQRSSALSRAATTAALCELSGVRERADVGIATVDVVLDYVTGCGPSWVAEPDVVHVDGQARDLRATVLPFTLMASVCGWPACAFPAGTDRDGLPIGLQVIGPRDSDDLVLDVAELLVPLVAR